MNIRDSFTADHRRIDALFEDTKHGVGMDWEATQSGFSAFRAALERHMQAEEHNLFPAYEARFGHDHPLTTILRKGHKDLRAFFDEIADAISAHDTDETIGLIEVVAQILSHHDAKEEAELYPVMTELFGTEDATVAALLS